MQDAHDLVNFDAANIPRGGDDTTAAPARNRRLAYQQPDVFGVRTFRLVSVIVPHLSLSCGPLGAACSVKSVAPGEPAAKPIV